MKRVFTAPDPSLVHHARNLLESAGIVAIVQGELRGVASVELPPIQCWPELWILETDDYQEACRVLQGLDVPDGSGESWECQTCHETIAPQFTACWQCGTERPLETDRESSRPRANASHSDDARE